MIQHILAAGAYALICASAANASERGDPFSTGDSWGPYQPFVCMDGSPPLSREDYYHILNKRLARHHGHRR